jgi:hypothetical protein
MTNKQQRQITAGPSREELFDALRLRHEGRTVTVTVDNTVRTAGDPRKSLTMKLPLTLEVGVDSIGIEDGSGNSWLLGVYDKDGKLGSKRLEGYFNTTRREGWIRPTSS